MKSILYNYLVKGDFPERNFQQGDHIFSQWDNTYRGTWVFLSTGVVKLTIISEDGKSVNLQYYQSPVLISTSYLFTEQSMCKYNLEVISDHVNAFILKSGSLKQFIKKDCENACYLIDHIQKQLDYCLANFSDSSIYGKMGSVCGQLLVLSYKQGIKKEHKILLEKVPTLEEIGCSSGIFHSSGISRIIARLKQEKVIEFSRDALSITNFNYLRKRAPKIDEWFYYTSRLRWDELNCD